MMRLKVLSLQLFAAIASLATPLAADRYDPRLGERHVDFTLPAIDDGQPVSLEQFRGKKVLLIQFASW
jgi:hypothetical protein